VIAMAVTQEPLPVRVPTASVSKTGPGPFHVFISYKREDQYIANVLVKTLESIDPSISCFFDQDIEEGNKWAEQINKELRNSDALILIYTGNQKNYETCVYEVATFQALHQDETESSITAAVTCLHDTDEIPTTFRPYQNCKIMTPDSEAGRQFARRLNVPEKSAHDFYLASHCGQFFKRLTERYHGKAASEPGSILQDLIASRAEEITKAFVHSSDPMVFDKVMYPRMWLEFDQDTVTSIRERKLLAIPDEIVVRADDNPNALNIFGLDRNVSTWGQVRAQCQKGSRTSTVGWMLEAEGALISVLCDETVRSIEVGFRSIDTRTGPDVYRCILTRRSGFRSGRQLLYFLFVRSRNRKLANDDAMALHLKLLLLATRFRFEVLKGEWSFRFENDVAQFDEQAHRFLGLIEKAEHESDEFGVMNSIANAFSIADQEKIEKIARAWEADLATLQQAIGPTGGDLEAKRAAVLNFIATWLPQNGAFLQMLTESFTKRLQLDAQST
jgi:hypothetical protein